MKSTIRHQKSTILFLLFCVSAVGAQSLPIMQSSFTGGEISPLASARLDAQRYYTSAATMVNLLAIPQGPAIRRPGTRYVAATDSNHPARLIPFRYSVDDVYTLEFTDSLMRVYRSHGLVVDDDNDPYELVTPFDANELGNVQVWQSADVCFLVDGTDWPQKLTRVDHNDWSIAAADINDGPFLKENLGVTTITASATTGTDVNLVASTAIFEPNHVGGYWKLRNLVAIQTVEGNLTAVDTNSPEVSCQAGNNFQWEIHGTWAGTMQLQLSYDSGVTWTAYTILTSESSTSTTEEVYNNDTGQDVLIRARCTEYTSGTVKYTLWAHAYMHTGVVQITDYTDPCNVECDVIRTLADANATVRWSEGAWSPKRGYPRAICAYSDRLVLASTIHQPVTIWFSETGEYEHFDAAAGDDADSFGYTMARSEQDPILWLTSQRRQGLIAGTTGDVFELTPLDSGSAITPSNPPTINDTLRIPCEPVAPVLADNILLVLQRGGRKLREVLYDYDADSLVSPDLTLFSEHVARPDVNSASGGLTGMTWTNQPYSVLWCVRSDGVLVSLTYDRNYQTVSWARHTLGGGGIVESVCSIPGQTEDELWLVVRREIDGATVRYVEYMSPWDFGGDVTDAFYVDCGLSYDGAAATSFSGLGHIEGQAAAILADGAPVESQTVSAGAVTLDAAASVVQIGLPYTSTLTTVRYDLAGETGVTWHRVKAVRRATVSFYHTLGAEFGPDADHLASPDWQTSGTGMLTAGVPELFSGDQELSMATAFTTDGASLMIVQEQPWPMTIRAIVAIVEVR